MEDVWLIKDKSILVYATYGTAVASIYINDGNTFTFSQSISSNPSDYFKTVFIIDDKQFIIVGSFYGVAGIILQ